MRIKKKLLVRIFKITSVLAKGIIISGISMALLLANPIVQSYLAQQAIVWLRKNKNIDIRLEKVQLIFPNQVGLKNAVLYDDYGDTVIYINKLRLSFTSFGSDFQNIVLSKAYLDSTHFYLLTHTGDSINGFMHFLDKLQTSQQDSTPGTFRLRINDIHFDKLRFKRIDVNNPKLPAFDVYNAHLRFRNFILSEDSIHAKLTKAYGTDDGFFNIEFLESDLTYADDHISVFGLKAKTSESNLNVTARLLYNSPEAFNQFADSILLEVDFKPSTVSVGEIRSLLPIFPMIDDFRLAGKFYGSLNDFQLNLNQLDVGNITTLSGDFFLRNLIENPSDLYLNLQIHQFTSNLIHSAHLYQIVLNDSLPEILYNETEFTASGQIIGNFTKMEAKIDFLVNKQEKLNLQFSLSELQNTPIYSAYIQLEDVQMGNILQVPSLGKTTGTFDLRGRSFNPEEIILTVKGNINRIKYEKYTYQDIKINEFVLSPEGYSGNIFVNDPYLNAQVKINNQGKSSLDFTEFAIHLIHSNPLKLLWTSDSLTHLSLNVRGVIDFRQTANPVGNIVINELNAENTIGYYHFEEIKILAKYHEKSYNVVLHSDLADMSITGTYSLSKLQDYLDDWIGKRTWKIPMDKVSYRDVNFSIDGTLKNLDALFSLFYLDYIKIETGTRIHLKYDGNHSNIQLNLQSPGVKYDKIQTGKLTAQISYDESYVTTAIIQLKKSRYDEINLDAVTVTVVNTLDSNSFEILWDKTDSLPSIGHIDGWLVKNKLNQFRLHFDNSNFNIGSEYFIINPNNYFDFEENKISVNNFQIINGQRTLLANGMISESPFEVLRVNFNDFRIDLFNIFLRPIHSKLDGIMQGEVILSNLLKEPKFASDFKVDSLILNNNFVGDLFFTSDWNPGSQIISVNSYITRGQLRTLETSGTITSVRDFEYDFRILTTRFRINALSPILGDFVQNLRGTVNSDLHLKGRTGELNIDGKVIFPNLGLTIPMLGTDYNIEGAPTVTINNRRINFSELIIRDTKTNSQAVLNGEILHNNFSDFRLNFLIDANKFLALNTTASSDNLYYGTAYVTGKIAITGPVDEAIIDVNVRTEKGTLFALPLNNPTEVGRQSFIKFVEPTSEKKDERPTINTGGFTLRFTIEVTPDAEAQLILDDRYNDMMRANGSGKLTLTVPPSGNIHLVGSYQISKGVYNFNFQGLISRKFIIEPGSSITFTGDPLAANLDITTRYSTRTTLRGLLTDERFTNTRTQVDLLLKISGIMFQPEISFDLQVPRAAPMVQTEINNALADRDRLTRQAFSLLLLNSFMMDDFTVANTSTSSTLVYDAFVSQISNLIGQRLKGVDIRLGYSQTNLQGQGNVNQQQDLELGISTTLFNDRFVINTNFDISTQQSPGNVRRNDFAGDVELEYLITPDGKVRAKAFNRSLQNRIGLEQVGDYAQGVGISYRTNFDSWFSDIFRMRRKKTKENIHFEEPDTSTDSSSSWYPKNIE